MDGLLDWRLSDTRVRVMSGGYRAKSRGGEVKAMCFSEEAGRPSGVGTGANGESQFRPCCSFSKVVFSEDRNIAIIKITFPCAPMSGAHESQLHLRKSEGSWRIKSGRKSWVS